MINKKAIVGIGTLIIFIATIVASLIAAAVLINATNLLQEKSLEVEAAARESIVSGLSIFSINGYADVDNSTIIGFELLTRLKPGSSPIELDTVGLTVDSPSGVSAALLNESKSNEACTFDNLTAGTEFCYVDRLSAGNSIIEPGDLYVLRFKLEEENALPTFTSFQIALSPRTGGITSIELITPEVILTERVRLR